jgi:DNA polymerase I
LHYRRILIIMDEIDKSSLFSIFENFQNEKKKIQELGISSVIRPKVLLIDGYNTFIRCFTAIPTLNEDGLHTGGISGFLKSIGYAIKLFKPDRCIIIYDGPGGSVKRRKIYPDYKKKRHTTIRLNRIYEDDSNLKEEEKNLKKQLQRTVEYLQSLPVNMLSLDSVEADDTIAYCAIDYFKDWDVIIMSADKDFLQLVNNRVKIWSPTKKKIYGPSEVLNEYGIDSKNFVFFRALDGDDSDNIDGVKGCGLKTILKAFPFFGQTDLINLNKIYEYCETKKGDLKIYEKILGHKDIVERNYNLMQLTDTQLQTYAQLKVNDILNQDIPKLNKMNIIRLIKEDKLWNNLPNHLSWLDECFSKLNFKATPRVL